MATESAQLPDDVRETLGRILRGYWIEFIMDNIPNPPASWVKPFEDLAPPMQEVDRVMGEKLLEDFCHRLGIGPSNHVIRMISEAYENG